jgi:hypothetical protein
MSGDTSIDNTQPSPGGENTGEARVEIDPPRMAAPSCSDIARGVPPAVWAPSELHNADKQAQPESASDFGIERSAQALGLPQQTIDSAKRFLSGAVSFTDAQLEAFDAEHQGAAETELRSLWGNRFDSNRAAIMRYLGSLPANAGEAFLQARDDTGRALSNDPAQLQRVLGLALRRGSFTLPHAVRDVGDLNAQILAIEQTMRTSRAAYNADELLQARYRELLTMRERAR